MKQLIDKIKKRGYWKVIIRPLDFSEQKIPTIEACINLIQSCVVRLRGWDYPHIDKTGIKVSGNNNIESSCDWEGGGYLEYWRFYQSGQFIHYFSMREDYLDDNEFKKIKSRTKSQKFLSILSTLYSVTEIFEFSRRLMEKGGLGENIEVIIELVNVEGRALFFWDFLRHLHMDYVCTFRDENIVIKRVLEKERILSSSAEIALDATIEIFKKFNWLQVPKNVFVEDQKKFLERRL